MKTIVDELQRRFDRLGEQWAGDPAFPVPVPPGDGMLTLFEEAFWTSLSRDEGRPCRFTISYTPDAQNERFAIRVKSQPFDRKVLRRLAAIAAVAEAEIAVTTTDGGLSVVGLTKFFRDDPRGYHQGAMPIEIEVSGPGHIVVRYGIFRVLTYADGGILPAGPNIFDMPGPFRSAVESLAASSGLPGLEVRTHLTDILRRVEKGGHGGIVLLSATQPSGVESIEWQVIGDVYGLSDLRKADRDNHAKLRLGKDHPDGISFSSAARRQENLHNLEREIAMITASLALVDGAVWLDGSLRPRGFGLFATVEPVPNIVLAQDAASEITEAWQVTMLGARHRAMVTLAANNVGCPAIAISIDGGFSAALRTNEGEPVTVWRFRSSDIELDDPFDPQMETIKEEWSRTFSQVRSDLEKQLAQSPTKATSDEAT